MSDLDDHNRRMTLGDAAGPPRSLGDVAGQMQLDAMRQGQQTPPSRGGTVDVATGRAVAWFAGGLVLLAGGVVAAVSLDDSAAVLGGVAAVAGGALAVFFGLGLLTVGLHRVGLWRVLATLLAGGVAWGLLAPWIQVSIGMRLPGWIVGMVAAAMVFLLLGRRRR